MSSTGKTLAFVAAAILILASLPICAISFLFVWGAFGSTSHPEYIPTGVFGLVVGIVLMAGGIGLILWAGRKASAGGQAVTLNVDLPGNVKLESLKCQSCGGALTSDNIKLVNGAPMVDCPYCHTTYQLTEAPKW